MKNNINAVVMETLKNCRQRRLLIGFSGGADSTALLLAARQAALALHRELTAVHFEHGIRGEASLADAAWCQQLCSELNIDFNLISLHIPKQLKHGTNIEETARQQRLIHWQKLAKDLPNSAVLLGHHNDDRIENMLLRLCRGSNVSGLTGLRMVAEINRITFIRPLLPFSKTEILAYLKVNGLEYRFDHTNQDNSFSRNFIRNQILPEIYAAIPAAKKGVVHAIDALEDDALMLEQLAAAKYRKISKMPGVPVSFWQKLPPALLVRVLRLWLTETIGTEHIPNHNLIKRFTSELHSGKTHSTTLPVNTEFNIEIHDGNCQVCAADNKPVQINPMRWHWQKQPTIRFQNMTFTAKIIDHKPSHFPRSPDHAWFDAALLPQELWLSVKQPGDRMICFGSTSPVKVKKIVTDAKLTATRKKSVAVVKTAADEIIWLPGIKNSAFAPVTNATTEIVFLTTNEEAST